jgi:hypothetical protein
MFKIIVLSIVLIVSLTSVLSSQCNNTLLFPTDVILAPYYNNEKVISIYQYAGDYAMISGYNSGYTYQVESSEGASDYISIYTLDNNLVAQGASPLTFIGPSFVDTLKVNFNLVSPPCGDDSSYRTTKIICNTCPSAGNVAIGNSSPDESAILDLSNNKEQGLLLPQVISEPLIPVPNKGLVYYNLTSDNISYYNGSDFIELKTNVPTMSSLTIPGSAFTPKFDCDHGFSNTKGSFSDGTILIAPLILPIGSIITNLKYFYYDNTSNNADIRMYDSSILSSNSTSSGYLFNTAGSTDEIQVYEFEFLNEIISSTKTYHFEFNPTGNTLNSNLAIKAIIVEYQNE